MIYEDYWNDHHNQHQCFVQTGTNAKLVGVCDGCLERPAFGRPLETYTRSLLGKTKTKTNTVMNDQLLDDHWSPMLDLCLVKE